MRRIALIVCAKIIRLAMRGVTCEKCLGARLPDPLPADAYITDTDRFVCHAHK